MNAVRVDNRAALVGMFGDLRFAPENSVLDRVKSEVEIRTRIGPVRTSSP